VHRDIKPENILLADKDLTVKLADFGLAKIIGEASFTTTLCGTPSYVAPEILQPTGRRKYTRAVDVWSLGVVLYICLCGFPPFSDELYTPDNPYTLAQQILGGRYDFPSPYWDKVGDPALDLIDRMLTVDPEQRISIDECLEHPWTTGHDMGPAGESILSTDGLLAGRMDQLDFSKRKPVRERTLLSSLNDVQISKIIDDPRPNGEQQPPVKVFSKNENTQQSLLSDDDEVVVGATQEDDLEEQNGGTAKNGAAHVDGEGFGERFLATGEKGDEALFSEDESSRYPEGESFRTLKAPDVKN
jgi:serine/threonine-protein kinase Chk2